jgi:hypothetical protein
LAKAAPRVVAKVEVPVPATARVEPVIETAHVADKVETVAKTTGSYPKADWLVILSADKEKEKEKEKDKPQLAVAQATPAVKPKAYAKAERDLLLRDYNAYVVRKSTDPYSNLK